MIPALMYMPAAGSIIHPLRFTVCAMAAAIGDVLPRSARALRDDPAVFSDPFISTFVHATGCIVYFPIAKAVLQIYGRRTRSGFLGRYPSAAESSRK